MELLKDVIGLLDTGRVLITESNLPKIFLSQTLFSNLLVKPHAKQLLLKLNTIVLQISEKILQEEHTCFGYNAYILVLSIHQKNLGGLSKSFSLAVFLRVSIIRS